MPKKPKVYPAERRRWLEEHEGGKSLAVLARESNRDTRTVKTHLQRAADERELSLARTGLYRGAFTQHNEALLDALRSVRGSLVAPHDERYTPISLFPRSHFEVPEAESLESAIADGRSPGLWLAELSEDGRRMFELAQEHLEAERRLWRTLAAWRKDLDAYVVRCYRLGKEVGSEVRERTGVDPAGEGAEGFRDSFVTWVCRLAIESASGRPLSRDPRALKVSQNQLRFDGATLGTSSSNEELESMKQAFVEVLRRLADNENVKGIVELRRALEEPIPALSRQLGDILMLGVVPGRCSLCKRLGF